MIWIDNKGHVIIKSNYACQTTEDILDKQKAIIHLLQTQNSDCFDEMTSYNALALLEDMLFAPEQIKAKEEFKEALETVK